MIKGLMIAAAVFTATGADASVVTFAATGALSSGFGDLKAGDPFSFVVGYDDATAGSDFGNDVYVFDSSATKVSYSVGSFSGTDDVLFYDVIDGNTLSIEQVGDDLRP